MSERPGQSSNSRPTLPTNPDTGSLKPEMGTDISALTTIRHIHQTNRDCTDDAVVEAIISVANEEGLDNLTKELCARL